MKAIITVGVSASGKTTWAEQYCEQTGAININRDDIRQDILAERFKEKHNPALIFKRWKFSKENEQLVSVQVDKKIQSAAKKKLPVVISDTNLNKQHRQVLSDKLTALGYEVEVKLFDVAFETALKRDSKRDVSVGVDVLMQQYKRFMQEFKPFINGRGAKVVIVDIDGTVAHANHRDIFDYADVSTDIPDQAVHSAVLGVCGDYNGAKIIFVSGRDDICYQQTKTWIQDNLDRDHVDLYMRKTGDVRCDTIVKREIIDLLIREQDIHIVAAFDDRPKMVRMWHLLDIKCFAVGNPYHEF